MIVIQRLSADDDYYVDAINKLRKQLSKRSVTMTWWEFLNGILCKDLFLFAAKDTEKVSPDDLVGMALISFMWRPEGWLGEIHSVVVDQQYRGKGIGDMLTLKLLETARQKATSLGKPITLYLTSKPSRAAANAMYQKHGFELVARAVGPHGTNLYKMKMIL